MCCGDICRYYYAQVKDMIEDNSSSEGDSPRPEINEYEAEPPSKKRFTLLDSVIQEKWKETLKETTKQPPGQIELDHYLCSMENVKEEDDILQFWVDQQLQYPNLSRIAVDVLVIPASSQLQVNHAEIDSVTPVLKEK